MADKTAILISLDTQSQGALAPYLSAADTTPLRGPLMALFQRISNTLPWAPRNLASIGHQMLVQGAFPRLRKFIPGERRPTWLANDDHYTQWRKMITELYAPIDSAFTSQNVAAAAAAAQAAANNTAVWDAIARYSGAAALERVWQDLQNALIAIRAQRDAAKTSLRASSEIINTYGNKVPPHLVTQTAGLTAKLNELDAKARAALAPVPAAAKEAGLGALPIIVAGIAAVTVTAVATSAWAISREFTDVQKAASANAQALLSWRESADAADYASGKITAAELTARRRDNVDAANAIVSAQGAAAVGSAVGAAGSGIGKGIGLALGGLATLFLGSVLVWRFARPKSAAKR